MGFNPLDTIFREPTVTEVLVKRAGGNALLEFAARHHTMLASLGVIAFMLVYQIFLYPYYISPLRHLPTVPNTHWLFGVFGPIVKNEAGILQMEWAQEYCHKRGSKVVRGVGPFGIERVMFTTPAAAQQILTDETYDFPRPGFMINTLGKVTGHGLLTVAGEAHRSMRRMMSPAFSNAHLAQLVNMFYKPLEACQRVLDKHIEEGEEEKGKGAVFDVYEIMSRCTLDIICDTAFGLETNSLEKGHELAEAYEQLIAQQNGFNLVLLILYTTLPGFALITELTRRIQPKFLSAPLYAMDDSMERIEKVSKELIRSKTGSMSGDEAAQGKDVLSLLVAANKAEDGSSLLNEKQMMDQVLTFLGAGHETTASGMSWTLWLLANHQEVQDKLRKECADLLARRIDPDMDQLNSLPYLDAVVKESLRVLPPVPMTFRSVGKKAKTVEGVRLPPGTIIYMGNRVMNTMPQLWGDDSHEFKPERWLNLGEDEVPGGSMYSFESFIHGPHRCIGASMATLEMKAMVTVLMSHYKFEKVSPDQEITKSAAITMKPDPNLKLRVSKIKTEANALS